MSKFEEQCDDSDAICPYCEYHWPVETEDFQAEGDQSEEECPNCRKQFWLQQSYTITHCTSPDCTLNNEQHDYQIVQLRGDRTHPFCTKCGKCQPVKDTNE